MIDGVLYLIYHVYNDIILLDLDHVVPCYFHENKNLRNLILEGLNVRLSGREMFQSTWLPRATIMSLTLTLQARFIMVSTLCLLISYDVELYERLV